MVGGSRRGGDGAFRACPALATGGRLRRMGTFTAFTPSRLRSRMGCAALRRR